MEIIVALLIALLAGIVVKFVLGFFDVSRPYADPVAFIVAVLVFLHELGAV